MKKIYLFLTSILLSVCMYGQGSGQEGNMRWELFGSNLYISGTGAIPDNWGGDILNFKDRIQRVNIDEGITRIGDFAFNDWEAMREIRIANSVTSIGTHAFNNCTGLPFISISRYVTDISSVAFWGCRNLQYIDIDPENPLICSDGVAVYSKDMTMLAFFPPKAGHDYYEVPEGVKTIGAAFAFNEDIQDIVLPSTLKEIGVAAFRECTSLQSLNLPNGLTAISAEAFGGCTSLTTLYMPESVTMVGDGAFSGCTNLKDLSVEWPTPPDISQYDVFYGFDMQANGLS